MTIAHEQTATETILRPAGCFEVAGAGQWAEALRQVLGAGELPVVLDLTDVESVDVTFFQTLVAFRKSLVARGRGLRLLPVAADHPVALGAGLLGIDLAADLVPGEAVS